MQKERPLRRLADPVVKTGLSIGDMLKFQALRHGHEVASVVSLVSGPEEDDDYDPEQADAEFEQAVEENDIIVIPDDIDPYEHPEWYND